jgi:integrase/recombinase XerC
MEQSPFPVVVAGAPPGPPAPVESPAARLLAAFLSGRSPQTLKAYAADLADFAAWAGAGSAAEACGQLLQAPHGAANGAALAYRAHLLGRGLAPATVNRRLAALRSLVHLARTLGLVAWGLDVEGVRSEGYRDTRGPGAAGVRRLLEVLAGRTGPRALTNGDVRKVQRFSRHKDVRVLVRYDDAREDMAGDVARRLAEG